MASSLTSTGLQEDDSPYPEVRSAVANTDDPSMPSSTVRSWTIGLVFAIVMAGLNQFFYYRFPSVTIGNVRMFDMIEIFAGILMDGDEACGAIVNVSVWSRVGAFYAEFHDLWSSVEPGAVLSERACTSLNAILSVG